MTKSRFAYLILTFQALAAGVSSVDYSLKFASAFDRSKLEGQRLVGGVNASLEAFPAYTFFANGECGGILISKNRVLTAASCVQSGHPDTVYVGASNRTNGHKVRVRCAKSHPLYVWPSFQYDIAVLKLEEDIITIETPTLNSFIDYPGDSEQDLVVAGMGRNTTSGFISERLEQVVYQNVPEDVCKEVYGDDITLGLHVCAYGRREGTCFGDTGGPLFDEVEPRWLVGIASGAKYGCAEFEVPDVYANVATLRDWIESQADDDTCDDECHGCLCPAYEFAGKVSARLSTSVQSSVQSVQSLFDVGRFFGF